MTTPVVCANHTQFRWLMDKLGLDPKAFRLVTDPYQLRGLDRRQPVILWGTPEELARFGEILATIRQGMLALVDLRVLEADTRALAERLYGQGARA